MNYQRQYPPVNPIVTRFRIPCSTTKEPKAEWIDQRNGIVFDETVGVNGSIFNNRLVDEVLSRWRVLPLNSPAYYPRYNGGIERGLGELKAQLPTHLVVPPAWHLPTIEPTLRALCLQQNARPRRALDDQSACHRFYHSPRRRFGKRERVDAFESIRSDLNARLKQMENPNRRDFHAAWRKATEHWLVCQNLIWSPQTKPVLPHFLSKMVSQIDVQYRQDRERSVWSGF